MTQSNETTLSDVVVSINKLTEGLEKTNERIKEGQIKTDDRIDALASEVKQLREDTDRFNHRYEDYRQATQWVVQLAFTLIASATLTVIVTSVLRR
jgi:predicted  nucleic acid-binding Zn-ribbon protein